MSVWNKVLVGLTIVVGLAYLFFAARALKARSYWGESVKEHEEALKAVAHEKELLLEGNAAEGKPGVRQLAEEVHRLVIGRGRVWRGSVPRLVKPDTGEVIVMTQPQFPVPHRDALKAQMYLFEEVSPQGKGAFLGEFSVAAVANNQWQLQPVHRMTDAERERLRRSRGPWSLYEVMPQEPADESQSSKVGSPEWRQKLVDFDVLMTELYRQRALLDDWLATTTADAQSVKNAEASARQVVNEVQKDIAAAKEELKAVQAQDALVAKHYGELEAKLAQLKDAVQKTKEANHAAARELARLQLNAIRRIDERTSKVARAAETY